MIPSKAKLTILALKKSSIVFFGTEMQNFQYFGNLFEYKNFKSKLVWAPFGDFESV